MKYKRLSKEDLSHLEKEFVNYLASAQITAPDWEKIKTEEKEKAEELIDVFSDMVYDKVVTNIKFLEFRDNKTLNVYNMILETNFNPVKTSKKRTSRNLGEILVWKIVENSHF